MARFKVIAARVNRIVDGNFVSHVTGEIVDLVEAEAKRLFRLKAVAPVDENGNVTDMPEPVEPSPHLDPDLEPVDRPASPAGEEPAAEPADVPVPRGNASLDEWAAYAKACGATDEDLDGLGQRQIREKFGPAAQSQNGEQES